MKRIGNLYEKVCSIENLYKADLTARKGKKNHKDVLEHDKTKHQNLMWLYDALKNKKFTTSKYKKFTIKEDKVRDVFKLPFFPDRIVHHALMNAIGDIMTNYFVYDTYNCIKGRGLHKASYKLRKALLNSEETKYCLKLDVKKFYPNIDNEILKSQLRRKFKDNDLLWLLDNIIDSEKGLPIGNLTSQSLANFYLTCFDRWLKQDLKIKHLFRYCDDICILGDNKEYLRSVLNQIRRYLAEELKLELKSNYQIFPIEKRGIDFVGYKHYHTHTELRKGIKKRFIKMMFKDRNEKSIASYGGWLLHCNSVNLRRKYLQC